jgi:hypothetical protein
MKKDETRITASTMKIKRRKNVLRLTVRETKLGLINGTKP